MIPSIFACHGGPNLVFEKNDYTDFLKELGKRYTPNPKLSLQEQYKIGQSIQELGEEDIMVIGRGATVHNLATVEWNSNETKPWAMEFDDWLIDKVEKKDLDSLFAFKKLAPYT